MAIIRKNYQDTLRMRYDFGPDPEDPNRRIRRARSYTRGKHNAADEQFYAMARAPWPSSTMWTWCRPTALCTWS